ncbi:type III-A CRISPR-associated RAMP protein Csm5 [Conservatibacter flavescens]|uniref:CRISPR system Cms protein Csm5 n=1 Tax=Conservatibacter flavescens TaxID=28161 RepID=A0A2M8S3D6_9PAST|nr:type III-A CRISPR-associated RAMP protein Csm5 [Conservatibacter flavescens]PJG85617.1 type III-A CRISPR-associated RAMP protein Csm5 [Conservatibacter flavescens]
MDKFLQHHRIYLTPITPIHIGCGEDFEPTNYVIDDGVLYHFNLSKLIFSPEKKKELLSIANSEDNNSLLRLQKFFSNHKNEGIAAAYYYTSVPTNIERELSEKLGKVSHQEKNGNKVISELAIERNTYLPYQGLAYIPGSSFKGAVVTAFLDYYHKEKYNNKKYFDAVYTMTTRSGKERQFI